MNESELSPKVKIFNRYLQEEEVRMDDKPYADYLECLETIIDFKNMRSFVDVGCATGQLIKLIKKKYPHIEVMGYDYFQYQKENADPLIADNIKIWDLRDPIAETKRWDIINCTEVAEHIDPDYTPIFIQNLKQLSGISEPSWEVVNNPGKTILLLTWSAVGGENDRENDPRLQHLHPKQRHEVDEYMKSKSWKKHNEATSVFIANSLIKKNFLPHWRESFGVWIPNWIRIGFY